VTVRSVLSLLLISCINNKVLSAISGNGCTVKKNTTGTHAYSTLVVHKSKW
jgi:hypothetical protein